MMSSKMRLKIRTKYKMNKAFSNTLPIGYYKDKIVVNNFKEKVKEKVKEKEKINYLDRYKVYLGYILN